MGIVIYKYTSPSNKSYIGQTSMPIMERFNAHCSQARQGSEFMFHQAIRKYGEENFTIEILEEDLEDTTTADKAECYWIKYFDTFKNGYNMTEGGHGRERGWNHSDESKQKMSEKAKDRTPWNKGKTGVQEAWNKGKKLTDDQKINMGHLHTDETKKKLSEQKAGIKLSKEHKKAISEGNKGEKNGMFGRKQSEETKQKIREKALARAEAKRLTELMKIKG
jgi:group I intron endonuclease